MMRRATPTGHVRISGLIGRFMYRENEHSFVLAPSMADPAMTWRQWVLVARAIIKADEEINSDGRVVQLPDHREQTK